MILQDGTMRGKCPACRQALYCCTAALTPLPLLPPPHIFLSLFTFVFFSPFRLPALVIISVTQTGAHFHISPQQTELGPDNYTPLCLDN